eukprot:scaffold192977_cov43-Tisochrysis_lutea.AAC.2
MGGALDSRMRQAWGGSGTVQASCCHLEPLLSRSSRPSCRPPLPFFPLASFPPLSLKLRTQAFNSQLPYLHSRSATLPQYPRSLGRPRGTIIIIILYHDHATPER